MENRDRILAAAARLYSHHGFRGTTTRLIAQEAEVNEVTVFRIFGSKEALIAEAIRVHGARRALPDLPADPRDPERELAAWGAIHLEHLRDARSLIRTCLGEIEDRPTLAPSATGGPEAARRILTDYLVALQSKGMADPDLNLAAAVSMFLGVAFADAMGREALPAMFPQPPSAAMAAYTRLFLNAIGARTARTAAVAPKRATRRVSSTSPSTSNIR